MNAGSDGYILNGNLESKPRFRLRPGKNVVRFRQGDDGPYYAPYVLLTPTEGRGLGASSDATSVVPS